jgi:hypothetical protein
MSTKPSHKPGLFGRIVLRLTHRLWNRQISRILGQAQQQNKISSAAMHTLAAKFDPTQRHEVY